MAFGTNGCVVRPTRSMKTTTLLAALAVGAACLLSATPAAAQAPAATARQGVGAAGKKDAVRNFATPTAIRTIACSSDGKRLAVVSDGKEPTVQVLDGNTGKTVATLQLTSGST